MTGRSGVGSMDDRKAAILKAVVDEYVLLAEPIGSTHLARVSGIAVSPATIRNEFNVLEQEGYLVQPHTSAGRIPTDKGYRFYVDTFVQEVEDETVHSYSVNEFFNRAHGALAEMFSSTSRLLTNLTNYAAVVTGPNHESVQVRSVQLISMGQRRVLVLLVDSRGVVEKKSIELAEDTDESDLEKVAIFLTKTLRGKSMRAIRDAGTMGEAYLDSICSTVLDALCVISTESETLYIEGASKVASAFDAVDTVRRVLATLEQHYLVVTLIRDLLSKGQQVAIGSELGLSQLAECSVVVSPYVVEGEQVGSIGLVGPTRMNYPKVVAAVNLVSAGLGKRLSEDRA